MNCLKKLLVCTLALGLFVTLGNPSSGQLVVDQDLGLLATGSTTSVSGDTAGAGDEAAYYGAKFASFTYEEEVVYQFSVDTDVEFTMTLTAAAEDPDFFILSSTDVELDGGGVPFAPDLVDFRYLDGTPPFTGPPTFLAAGTYYVVVANFDDGITTTFSLDLEVIAGDSDPPEDFIDLGAIAGAGEAFTVDSFGSTFDTELGLWSSDGVLLDENDDTGGLQSELQIDGLKSGDYYVGLGEFDSIFGFGFFASSNGTDGGDWTLNYNGQSTSGNLAVGTIQYFRFTVESGSVLKGDVNLDGVVDLLDVNPFVDLLTSSMFQAEADTNCDGAVNLLDVGPFVDFLTGG